MISKIISSLSLYIYISKATLSREVFHWPQTRRQTLSGWKERGALGERNINQAWVISVSESRLRPASGQQQEHGSLRSVRRKRIELPVAILVEFGIDIRLLEIMRGRWVVGYEVHSVKALTISSPPASPFTSNLGAMNSNELWAPRIVKRLPFSRN